MQKVAIGETGVLKLRDLVRIGCVAALLSASGCATDIGSFTSSDPAPAPAQQQVASNPSTQTPVPYGQPAPLPSQQQPSLQLPPQGQAAFAPAPKPGGDAYAAGASGAQAPAQAGRKLGETELRNLLTGQTIAVADGRSLEYGRAGSYQETRNGQAIAVGTYQIRDVSVCVQFTTGLTRCDSIVQDGDSYFVEDRNGQRLPAQLS